MYVINGNDIELTQGDSLVLRVSLIGRDLPEGSVALFTVKRKPKDTEFLIQKRMDASDEQVVIALTPSDTDLEPRTYYWDLRLLIPLDAGGWQVETPMEYASFTVVQAIGRNFGVEDNPGYDADAPVLTVLIQKAENMLETFRERGVNVRQFGAKCDGVSDDSEALQAAIDSGASLITVPEGTSIGNPVVLAGNVTLEDGGIAFLTPGTLLKAEGKENILLRNLKIHFNASDTTGETTYGGMIFDQCQNVRIEHCELSCPAVRCVQLTECQHVRVTDCRMTGVHGTAITFYGGEDAHVVGCSLSGVATGDPDMHAIDFYATGKPLVSYGAINCTFDGIMGNGVQITSNGTECSGGEIVSCRFVNYGAVGVKVDGVNETVLISGCVFDTSGAEGTNGYGIVLGGGRGAGKNVGISDCVFDSLTGYPIRASGTYEHLIVHGCRFVDCSMLCYIGEAAFGSFEFVGNVSRNSAVVIQRNATAANNAQAGIVRIEGNTFVGGGNWYIFTPLVDYMSLSENEIDTPAETSSGLLTNIAGITVRCENNHVRNKATNKGFRTLAASPITTLWWNGNTINGADMTVYNSADVTTVKTYALS